MKPIKQCPMCGKSAHTFTGKWYQYDSGQQFLEFVCNQCVAVHSRALQLDKVRQW
jgi:hypothetical protein